ncbi:preprotein translocase subunit SecA [Neisseria sp. 83E34]|nr:preprotein translocase subunit SecA [Neisseria sp. 83E34]
MTMNVSLCPCQSGLFYADCCAPLHQGKHSATDAETLMRSRYAAYVLQQIDYIVSTTVPAQQALLNRADINAWSRSAEWLGLTVLQHRPKAGKHHAQVEFEARFSEQGETHIHRELSAFVSIDGTWYFIDPTVPLPSMKTPCFCGSGKKFKQCCGQFLRG